MLVPERVVLVGASGSWFSVQGLDIIYTPK